MRDDLVEVVREAEADDAIGALVLTGAGRAFCAGADIAYMRGGTYFLPRLVGAGRALELAFTADMIPAAEACRLGLFNRIVDDAAVVEETLTLAAQIAAKPRMAVSLAKQSLRAAYGSSLAACLERERVNQMRLFKSPDAIDGMRAFLSRRGSS
jgi:2-(1,2-epoxy-1,2-dihydrophenyl)acetyl-CoA isomerase